MRFEDFTGLYPVSKTLRFEARPVGNTLKYLIKSGLLEQDTHRADSYQKIKKLIDEYHKAFIDSVMSGFMFSNETLEEYFVLYANKSVDNESKNKYIELQKKMRESVSKALKGDERFKNIDKKELIKEDLYAFVRKADESQLAGLTLEQAEELLLEFKDFTTYFGGFHQNRANMYVPDEKSTSIAYRLVNENLPRFVDNIYVFKKIYSIPELRDNVKTLYDAFKEHLNVVEMSDIFDVTFYSEVLTQKHIDLYNSIIGGRTDKESSKKIQGLNEYINLYNQTHKDEKLPKFKVLYKQILSDRVAVSWLPEAFSNDNETLCAIRDCYSDLKEHILGEKNLKILLESLDKYDLCGVFISNNKQLLSEISQKLYGNWGTIDNAVRRHFEEVSPQRGKNETEEKYRERIAKSIKRYDSFSIADLNEWVKQSNPDDSRRIEDYFASLGVVNSENEQKENLFRRVENAYTDAANLLSSDYPEGKKLAQDSNNVKRIKNLLDAIKELQWFVKPLNGSGDENNKDERFYGEFSMLWAELDSFSLLYDKVRNYMTRKPYSQDKIKLNFANATLLKGWDRNKEVDNACVILRRNGLYYLGIMDKEHRRSFEGNYPCDGDVYEKMVYKLLPDPKKMLPKVFFSKSREKDFNPSDRILQLYKGDTYKAGPQFKIEDCRELIDFYKRSISLHEDWKNFGFQFSDTSTYEDLNGFYREVEQQGYKMTFKNVSVSYVEKLVDEGKLYLFQLYNKDFSAYSKGTPNIHTLYWKAVFDEKNLLDVVYKLNGEAELFFRKKSINITNPTHPANVSVANKNKLNQKRESVFDYDLIKDRRYTVDKFLFHVPITMNFKSKGKPQIEQQVRSYLHSAENTHIIGIDRGERHLLYVSVIDNYGNIKEQFSLNEIVNENAGNVYVTDYHALLDTKEAERKEARQSWQTIENIKELKEGYLSQAVHKVTQLMIKYNAIVVLEDLNMGFMRGRQKVEKQVYQKFEKMLIDKLNYLVDKKICVDEPGGIFHAYQLASKFESFSKLGKQSGFLFYIPAWNTSKIDPVTGFVNLFDLRYESIERTKLFFSKFKFVRYNQSRDWFEFAFDYNDFTDKATGTRTEWNITTHGTRIITFRNPEKNSQWDSREVVLTDEFKVLFSKYGIALNGNLKESIAIQTDRLFFETLLNCFKLTLQMRNSITGTDIDYLISPVADENGVFYDSRNCSNSLPKNADANGAYNIARKGLMLIDQIKHSDDFKTVKFDITNKAWLEFAQKKPYLND